MPQSGDGVAMPLTLSLTVGVVGLTLRGGPFIRSTKLLGPKNLLSGLFAN